jgi:hypothetical protein
MDTVPPTALEDPPGPAPEAPPRPKPDNSELECERGRVVEEASFGNALAPFRAVPLGVPDARLLRKFAKSAKDKQSDNKITTAS